jgi:hypothetical protein
VNEKTTVGSPLLVAFSSDRIPKAKKNVNVLFIVHNFSNAEIPVNNSAFRDMFEATTSFQQL